MNIIEISYILRWWFMFLLIGISFLPLTFIIFNKFVDKGYIFSKIIGLLIISFLIFILSTLKILNFSFTNLLFVWILIALPQIYLLKIKKNQFSNINIRLVFTEEIIFIITLFIWAYIKGFNPDIHDLEKFMDFGFINSFLRSEYFPPRDIWYTPLSINYYYFGHLYTAVITKLTHIPSYFSFNLMLSTIFAFTFTMSFSIGINLVNKIKKLSLKKLFFIGLIFSYFVTLSGNLQTIYAFLSQSNGDIPKPFWTLDIALSTFPNSYWYPTATRFIYHTIHEFPSYSFVVADLHGHVLSIPIVLTILAVYLVLFISKNVNYKTIILISFLLSVAYMTNAWDGLIYMGLSIIVLIFIYYLNSEGKIKDKLLSISIQSVKSLLILAISFFSFTYIFNKNFDPFASNIGLNCSPEFLINIQKLGPFIFESGFCQATPFWQLLILYGFFIFIITSFFIFLRKKKLLTTDIFVLLLSIFSLILILTPEIIYLKDIYTGHFRANTMFKLSYQAFIMLSISSIYAIFRILFELKTIAKKSKLIKFSYFTFFLLCLPLLFLVIIYPYFAIPSGYKDLKNRKDLDGIKYLEKMYPSDYKSILWINNNITGQPVLLEAQGDSYTNYARISSNTGLPTVLGWTVHEWLWRGSYDIPASRFTDITNLYETTDLGEAKKIIDKYNIKYIYIGNLEREKYNIAEDKFLKIGKIVFYDNEAKIYEIF